jgi:hypothetical protein
MHYPFSYDHTALSFFLGSQCIKLFFSFKLVLWAQVFPFENYLSFVLFIKEQDISNFTIVFLRQYKMT